MRKELKNGKAVLFNKILLGSLTTLNVVFLIYYVILAFYSRFHYDDLNLMWMMKEMSFWEVEKNMYLVQTGRFVFIGINAIVTFISYLLGFHQFWPILFYLLGVGICYYVAKDFTWHVSKWGVFMAVCFVYNLYVLTAIDFPVFYWLVAMQYYLFLPVTLLLLKLLNSDSLNWKQWIALIISVIFLGGVNEAYTPMVLLLMLGNGLYLWWLHEWDVKASWTDCKVRRIVWAAIALLVLWIFVIAAPGNYVRLDGNELNSFVRPHGLFGYICGLADAMIHFFYFMVFYVPYYFVVFALAFCLGTKSEIILNISKSRLCLLLCVGFLLYLLISSLPIVFVYGGFGIQRVYTHAVLAMLLTVFALGYICGVGRESLIIRRLTVAGILVLTVIMCVNIVQDTPSARAYAKSVDDRMEYLTLLQEQGQKETVTVLPFSIPYTKDCKYCICRVLGKESKKPVLYYISDTGPEPTAYEFHLKRLMGFGFDFVTNGGETETDND